MAKQTWILGLGAAAAAAFTLFAAPAHAGGASIHLSIGTPGYSGYYYPQPYVYTQPSYVYTQPTYVYTQPTYVYTQPGYVYTRPGYVYTRPGYVYTQPSYGFHGQPRYHRGGRDRDRDGIPNRFDRDRDGDGVPNRFDRRPNNPYRH